MAATSVWHGFHASIYLRKPGEPKRSSSSPPLRFPAGADAVATLEQKAQTLLAQAGAYRELASSLAYDDA